MVKTEPWNLDEVPDVFRRYLSTKNGKEQIVFMWPTERNTADYQAAAWEEELDILSKKINDEKIAHSKADETLIIAWVYRLIEKDSLPLLTVAAIVVLILLALDFRNFRDTLLVAFPLLVGMGVLVCVLYLGRFELNMFNIIVVPSLIGIGIDNAVHIYHRYKEEGPGSLATVIRTTGMAALLASLTTGVGFGSSLISHHIGLKSLGALAVIGICATFLANTIFFPCLLSLLEKRKQR
jgi:predicted RND superfamily exporter protein